MELKNLSPTFLDNMCLCVNGLNDSGITYTTPENSEGNYGVNNGIVAFVYNHRYYVTPFVNQAIETLQRANFKNTGLFVPFSINIFNSFPNKLSDDEIRRLWIAGGSDPSFKVMQYYYTLMERGSSFRRWNQLLKNSGTFSDAPQIIQKKGLEYYIELMLKDIYDHKEEYNKAALEQLDAERKSRGL